MELPIEKNRMQHFSSRAMRYAVPSADLLACRFSQSARGALRVQYK